jgi:radical SAM superfamily enzyme YgiQ (UPF0313 family)
MSNEGFKVVLTADRTLMSEYSGGIFLGFSACVPKGLIPDWLYFSMFCPSVPVYADGSVKVAPCGTRKIESALLNHGFKRKDIVVAHPDHLEKVVGPNTRVVGVTETDPMGVAPATSTFTQLFNGEAYTHLKFMELLNNPAIKKYKPKIIVGGAGAWQLENSKVRHNLGVNCVVIGEADNIAGSLFENAANNKPIPEVVQGDAVSVDDIPLIRGATVDGIIEITRGCGRGCEFCVPTMQSYRCRPINDILKEVKVNLKAGRRPLLHAEDVLRYKAKGLEVNSEAVIDLFKTVRAYPGVHAVALSHFALSSVASAPEVVEAISNILDARPDNWISGQTGLETGSPRLIQEYMKGKCRPFEPQDWPNMAVDAFQVMSDNHWVPCATMIIGFPDETDKDIECSLELVEELRQFKSLIVPLLLVSMGGFKDKAESYTFDKFTPKQAELFMRCWKHNINWGETLLGEYFVTNSGAKGYALKFLFAYSMNQAKKLMHTCEHDYNYDLATMIKDAKNGKTSFGPAPIRFIYKILRSTK